MRKKSLLGLLIVFTPAILLIFLATIGIKHNFQTLDDYGLLKPITFTGADQKQYSLTDFEGDILLITTIQNTCPNDCAISFWHLNQIIYQHIRKNSRKKMKQVRIISFVTDGKGNPSEDVSAVTDALRDQVEGYDPKLWIVAKGNVRDLFNITHNNQNLLQQGKQYYGGEAFQELMLLADKKNHLRMVLRGNQEGLIRRMKESIALLHKQYDQNNARNK